MIYFQNALAYLTHRPWCRIYLFWKSNGLSVYLGRIHIIVTQ